MVKIFRTALVSYSDKQMFDLVNDIKSYSDFLPWCRSSLILSESDREVSASLEVSRSGLNKTFTTRNELFSPKRIVMHLVDGPFKRLRGEWLFDVLGDQGCKVSLNLEFEFKNSLVGIMLKKVFEPAANEMLDAFIKRAKVVYGKH